MLPPIGAPVRHDLQDRGYHFLAARQGLPLAQQLNLACRTLLAMLLLRRPDPSAPKAPREAFKTLCTEVQVWLKDEIAEGRRSTPAPTTGGPEMKSRSKVGDA